MKVFDRLLIGCSLFSFFSCVQHPDTSFAVAEIDFGLFPQSVHIHKADIIIKNTGGGILELSEPVSSCDCTTAVLSSRSVHRGRHAVISVTYNSEEKWTGPVNQGVSVKCNSKAGELFIRLSGCMYDDSGITGAGADTYPDWQEYDAPIITYR